MPGLGAGRGLLPGGDGAGRLLHLAPDHRRDLGRAQNLGPGGILTAEDQIRRQYTSSSLL